MAAAPCRAEVNRLGLLVAALRGLPVMAAARRVVKWTVSDTHKCVAQKRSLVKAGKKSRVKLRSVHVAPLCSMINLVCLV